MTGRVTVLLADEFSVSDDHARRLRATMPEVSSVERVNDLEEVCVRAHFACRVVVIVNARSSVLGSLARRLSDIARGGILTVVTAPADVQVSALFTRGIRGMVHSLVPAEELITAIRAVAEGHAYVPARYLPVVAEAMARNPGNGRAAGAYRVVWAYRAGLVEA